MKKIINFNEFLTEKVTKDTESSYTETIITERFLSPSEVEEISQQMRDDFEKGKAKIGKIFGAKNEEALIDKLRNKYAKYGDLFDQVILGAAPKYSSRDAWGEGDGMRHDDEFGLPWDDFNSER
jgi:hypothetical protein